MENLKILDVGCGTAKTKNAVGIDSVQLPEVDIVHDLNLFPWPADNESYDEIVMNDIIEHLPDTIKVMEECYRILKPGGKLKIRVVYWNHFYSYTDPTHVKAFTLNTWKFFTGDKREYYTKARFKLDNIDLIYDRKALRNFKFKKLLRILSYYLCNIIQGMNVQLTKEE